ncbi:MAG: threonylcarbamoyl-AMP synthase [Flavobacteriales bacterium]|nr:threonylcarbamoyl-AMP synthase [Flavobacteriales bacterium]MCB9193565.1 threonylcarbamoyl-AMP synthase [Flavobacteriales bacterium]
MKAVIGGDVSHAVELLRAGELVAIPTETVYGLAANAFDPRAVLRVFEVKDRPAFDPLIVHIGDRVQLERVVAAWPREAEALARMFWPGPLTLVLPRHPDIPDLVTSGADTVAVRMPDHPQTRELLHATGFPLAAPSANPFGYVSPTSAWHVAQQLGDRIPYILDGGPCGVGVESTIVAPLPEGGWELLRPGGIPVERIEPLVGELAYRRKVGPPVAPGMLSGHYAPRKPVHVGDLTKLARRFQGRRTAMICFHQEHPAFRCEVLSPSGDLAEAAMHLFAVLRELDESPCEVILAEEFPEEGLGRAINDRLRRASAART